MKRIASGSQAASAPASYGADVGTPGYFQDASTTPAGAPTQLTAKWANMVQEGQVRTITDSGAALADDLSQFSDTVAGVHAIKSGATTTGTTTTARTRSIVASDTCAATAATSAVVGSSLSLASGVISAVVGSGASTASGAISAVVGAYNSTASGAQSVVIGGTGSTAGPAANAAVLGGNGDATGASSAVVAGDGATASGVNAVTLGGINPTASGDNAAVLGGSGCQASGDRSTVTAGADTIVNAADSFAAGASTSYITQGQHHAIVASKDATTADTTGTGRLILASRGVVLASSKTTGGNTSYVVGGGYSVNTVSGLETANADLNWTIDSQTGTMRSNGSFSGSTDPNADVAEYHPNVDGVAIPVGCLVTNVGRAVRLAVPGDRVFGVVSATPLLVAGAADLEYSGKYMTDQWGRTIWADVSMVRFEGFDGRVADAPRPIPDGATFYTARDRVLSSDYDPTREYVPRTERPTEWTPVAKLGVVRVRVDWNVNVGDLLAPGADGVAVATDAPIGRREVEVLEILSPYDDAMGYAIALCDVG